MKVLIVSDITLDNFRRTVESSISNIEIELLYTDNLILKLKELKTKKDIDVIYIHIDSIFKKYEYSYVDDLYKSLIEFVNRVDKPVVYSNLIFPSFSTNPISFNLGTLQQATLDFSVKINQLLNISNIYSFDLANLVMKVGRSKGYNYRLGHLYQMPYTKTFLNVLEKNWISFIQRIFKPDKKVIILDCDNTLWRGIVGEDGLNGIKCNLNHDGIFYYHFQKFLFQKKEEGFLLALCSKNNQKDVKKAFNEKQMPLKWDDFILKKINWEDKQYNIRKIAEELSLGLDSLIFIDDSDFEINSIKTILPDVHSIQVEDSYSNFYRITEDYVFAKKNLTQEDRNKTDQYIQEFKRNEIENKSETFDEYIKSLNINIDVKCNPKESWGRISQLTEKTNQFNFNKKIYSAKDFEELTKKNKISVYTLNVNDRFGDYGLVGVIIVRENSGKPILENYIMSCRALGRRIEYDFYNEVYKMIKEKYNSEWQEIKFKKTDRNKPAEKFYKKIN